MRVIERRATRARSASGVLNPERVARLEEWTRRIAKPRHIEAEARENERLCRWLVDAFERLGYEVTVQGPLRNVVALPRGQKKVALVGAHYDSVPDSPGADDNASGVAVLLEVATTLAHQRPDAPVGFVAFNAEEDGLLGSADFVAHGREALGLEVAGIHVLEMVGFATAAPSPYALPSWIPTRAPERGDFLGLLANARSHPLLERAFEEAATATPDLQLFGLKTYLGVERLIPVLLLSDHSPFWRAKVPALLWTDTAFYRNPNYHQTSDTWDTLDYSYMERVASLMIATVLG